jgi:hypothetical protein
MINLQSSATADNDIIESHSQSVGGVNQCLEVIDGLKS